VAYSRLPRLRAMAPEFYDSLLAHRSWAGTLWQLVMREDIGGYTRLKRRRSNAAPGDAIASIENPTG
jgi:hypothetical protein